MEIFAKHRSKIVLSLLFGLAVVATGLILGDFNKMVAVLRDFQWWLVGPILLLVLCNYGVRFIKWHYYLKVVGNGAEKIGATDSAIVFISGMSMAVTPGKLGEFLKSYLVNQLNGTPMMVTAPIIVAERVSDGVSMLLLASLGVFFFENTLLRLSLLIIFLISVALFVVIQWRSLALKVMDGLGKIPFLSSRISHLHRFYESSYRLFSPRSTMLGVVLGLLGWSCECVAFFLVMVGLGFEGSALLLVQCTFILATATLVGSFSMLPGGLGAAESSIGGLLLLVVKGMTGATASAGTLLIRFCTLWFGFALGFLTLFIFRKRFDRTASTEAVPIISKPAEVQSGR